MNKIIKVINTLFFTLILLFASSSNTFAATHTLSGNVSANTGNKIAGANIDVIDAVTNNTVTSTTSDSLGNYTVMVADGVYNVKVSPPAESNWGTVIALSHSISADTVLNFILTPIGTVTLSGHIYDIDGKPLPDQTVSLVNAEGHQFRAVTNSEGVYSLQVTADVYQSLQIFGTSSSSTVKLPEHYVINIPEYNLEQSTVANFTIPVKKVVIHVQNAANEPLENVKVISQPTHSGVTNNLPIGNSLTNARGSSWYENDVTSQVTDESGNVTLWLFENDPDIKKYSFIAVSAVESGYGNATISDITITSMTTQTIILPSTVSLNGHIFDVDEKPIPNQTVLLVDAQGIPYRTTTNSEGKYSLQVTAGTYQSLQIFGSTGSSSVKLPEHYLIHIPQYEVLENAVANFTIPVKKVVVHVQNAANEPLENVKVISQPTHSAMTHNLAVGGGITNAQGSSWYESDITSQITDELGNVTLWLFENDPTLKTYSFIASPPNGNVYGSATISDVTVADDTTQTIVLPKAITLSGRIYDIDGKSLPNQIVNLVNAQGNQFRAVTNTEGEYSLQVTADVYQSLQIFGTSSSSTVKLPEHYVINIPEYNLEQSTVANFAIPVKKVVVHVQGADSQPLTNAKVTTYPTHSTMTHNLVVGGGVTNAQGSSWYENDVTAQLTDESGNVTLWLFENDPDIKKYAIIVAPPAGSMYSPFTLNDISVNEDQTEIISLQYVNNAPIIDLLENAVVTEGSPYSVVGSFTDQDSMSWSASVDYGDDTGSQLLTLNGSNFMLDHKYQDNGTYTVLVTVTDNQGAVTTEDATITVSNSNPNISIVTSSINPIQVHTLLSTTASFTDPGLLDTHTSIWDWGDGTTSNGNIIGNTISGDHTYSTAGVYEITLTVRDDDNGISSYHYQYQTVYDVNAGWSAGSKEYLSPVGALVANSSATGKVDFGFQVKYQQGDPMPSGKNIEFSFPAGNIEFSSTAYEWLVISGAKATLKAAGTLNGIPGHTMLISAIDQGNGQRKGLIRVQIKNGSTTVYDTQLGAVDTNDPTTPISKGKITVH